VARFPVREVAGGNHTFYVRFETGVRASLDGGVITAIGG